MNILPNVFDAVARCSDCGKKVETSANKKNMACPSECSLFLC